MVRLIHIWKRHVFLNFYVVKWEENAKAHFMPPSFISSIFLWRMKVQKKNHIRARPRKWIPLIYELTLRKKHHSTMIWTIKHLLCFLWNTLIDYKSASMYFNNPILSSFHGHWVIDILSLQFLLVYCFIDSDI